MNETMRMTPPNRPQQRAKSRKAFIDFPFRLYPLFLASVGLIAGSVIVCIVGASTEGWLFQHIETGDYEYDTLVGLSTYTSITKSAQVGGSTSRSTGTVSDLAQSDAILSISRQTIVYLSFAIVAAVAYLALAAGYIWRNAPQWMEKYLLGAVSVHFFFLALATLVYGLGRPKSSSAPLAGYSFYYSYIMTAMDTILVVPALVCHGLEMRARFIIEKKLQWSFRRI